MNFLSRHLRPVILAMAVLAATLATGPVLAAEDDPDFVLGRAGFYDINDNEEALEFGGEYRWGKKFWIFKPFAGATVTTDRALYGYGGVLVDIYFGRRLVLTPNFAAGLYSDGDGKDLGSTIEFRSGLEAAYRFDDRSRLGVGIYHISNAGIDKNNPGTEIFSIFYAFPM